MDVFMENQLGLKGKIASAFSNFKKKGRAQMSKSAALTRLEQVVFIRISLTQNHTLILSSDTPRTDEYFTSGLPDIVEKLYLDVKAEFREFLVGIEDQEREAAPPVQTAPPQPIISAAQGSNPTFAHTLPKIEIPKFSGKWDEWAHFRYLYKSIVHRRDDIGPLFKFYYLSSLCEGEALEKFKSLEITADNYNIAWTNLTDFYENKRRMVNQTIGNRFALKPMRSDSLSEMKKLYIGTLDILSFLDSMGRSVNDHGTDLLVYLTISRLDPDNRKDWEKLLGNSTEPPTIDQMKKFFEDQMATLESIESGSKTVSAHNTPKNQSTVKAHNTVTQLDSKSNNNTSCPMCHDNHFLYHCKTFKSKGVLDRKSFVTEKRLCFQCLGPHPAKYCKSKRKCIICKYKHNSLLHIDKLEQGDNSCHDPSSPEPKTSATPLAKKSDSETTNHLIKVECLVSSPSTGIVLLSTAIIRVFRKDGSQFFVRALVDQCSQSSFISSL